MENTNQSMAEAENQNENNEQVIEIAIDIPKIVLSEFGMPVTSTLEVARYFNKRHDNVLRDIEKIISEISEDFTALNFGVSSYTDNTGKTNKLYNLTKDGFTLLAMGFTGKKAMQFKIAYITAFNAMEQELKEGFEIKVKNNSSLHVIIPTKNVFKDFEKREKITDKYKTAIMGLMHFTSYINHVSYETIEQEVFKRFCIDSVENLKSKRGADAIVFLWDLARTFNYDFFTRDESLDEVVLMQNAISGLIDFWPFINPHLTKAMIENYICNKCNIDSIDLSSIEACKKVLFVLHRGLYLYIAMEEEQADSSYTI